MSCANLIGAIALWGIAAVALPCVQDPPPSPEAQQQRLPGPLVAFVGSDSKIATGRSARIVSKDQWASLWLEHTGQEKPSGDYSWFYNKGHVPEVDFEQCMVLAVFEGARWNSAGVRIVEVFADAKRTLVRLDHTSFQTAGPTGGAKRVTPFGMFVLPRRAGPVVLEMDVQRELHEPPIWKELATL